VNEVRSPLSRLFFRLLLIPVAVLLAPLYWIGAALLALAFTGEQAAALIGIHFPPIPGLYQQAASTDAAELLRIGMGLAGVIALSVGYFPTYDLWRRGCNLEPVSEEEEEEEVYFIP